MDTTKFLFTIPVLPSADIDRDIAWYREKAGFEPYFGDNMYAGIMRENIYLHLQWHADTSDDPLLGGSVVRIFVKNIEPLFHELVTRKTVAPSKLIDPTPWGTKEVGFFDLNNNAVFFVEDLE